MGILLDLTFDELQNFLGVGIQGVAGTDIWFLGLLFLLFVMFILYKLNVGMEGGIIIGLFGIYLVTRGFPTAGGGQGGLISDAVWIGAVIAGGFILYLWLKRDVL